jgi:hypothetical protein
MDKQHHIPTGPSTQSSMESTATVTQNATTVELSESATSSVTYTEQQSPLLRLPAELRNRIYAEVFRSDFESLEVCIKANIHVEPKYLRSLLRGLNTCRQFRQEALPLLFRNFVAGKPYWHLREQKDVSVPFARTKSFCRIMERYAPQVRFSAEPTSNPCAPFAPEDAQAFVEELARQLRKGLTLAIRGNSSRYPELVEQSFWRTGRQSADAMSSDSTARTALRAPFSAHGRVGEYSFTYRYINGLRGEDSHLILDGPLARLDWDALKKSILHD